MVSTAVISFFSSVAVFGLLLLLVSVEARRGRRLFATSLRSWFDHVVSLIKEGINRKWRHFTRYIVQLGWYYSLHSILQGALRVVVAVYNYFEHLFEHNRRRAKRLRAEKRILSKRGHLGAVATHKEENALSAVQKQQLRDQKLEGD